MLNISTVVHSDPEILGDSLDEFLDSFPSVSRAQAIAALELACEMIEAHVAAL